MSGEGKGPTVPKRTEKKSSPVLEEERRRTVLEGKRKRSESVSDGPKGKENEERPTVAKEK